MEATLYKFMNIYMEYYVSKLAVVWESIKTHNIFISSYLKAIKRKKSLEDTKSASSG